jgi:hypothetical protein
MMADELIGGDLHLAAAPAADVDDLASAEVDQSRVGRVARAAAGHHFARWEYRGANLAQSPIAARQ